MKGIEPVMPNKNEQRAPVDATRQKRMLREMETFSQRLLFSTETERNNEFWKKLPLTSIADFEKHTAAERDRFWNDVIGRFPDPNVPMNARSRFVRETDKVAIYEVTLDVWHDVFAWGWLCLPKDIKPGDKRPVVVCQHGLEGMPRTPSPMTRRIAPCNTTTPLRAPRRAGLRHLRAAQLRIAARTPSARSSARPIRSARRSSP